MNRQLIKEYNGEWEINKWSNLPNKGAYFVTPVISPIASDNIRLFFELKWDFFQTFFKSGHITSFLELRIFRESMSGGKNPSELEAEFEMYYSDGRLLRECKNPFPLIINNLSNCCFDRTSFKVRMPDKKDPLYFTNHNQKLKNNNFTLKCHLKFYDYAPPKEIALLKNLQKFTRKMSFMYESNIFTDFTFKIGNKTLHAHKAVLSAQSPVLARMVSSDFLESKENTVVITDCTFETFDSFLRYLYSGELITPAWRNVLELYIVADKYDVEALKENCVDILINTLNADRLQKVVEVANLYRDFRLAQAIKAFLEKLASR